MRFTEVKERYINGDVIEYECITPGENTGGNATCFDGKWSKPVGCDGKEKCK